MQFYTPNHPVQTAGRDLHARLLREARVGIAAALADGSTVERLANFSTAVGDDMDDATFSALADCLGLSLN